MGVPLRQRWVLVLCLGLLPESSPAVTIYRFGGEDLPPPLESARDDVEFLQLDWGEISAESGGEHAGIRMEKGAIGPRKLDPGRNVAALIWKRDLSLELLFDDDPGTAWIAEPYECGDSFASRCDGRYGRRGVLNIDFADRVLIDRIRLFSGSRDNPLGILRNFGLSLSPTPLGSNRTVLLPFLVEVLENEDRSLVLEFPDDLPAASALQIAMSDHAQPWSMGEIEIFARGVAGKAAYTADILDFGKPAVWGEMRWSMKQEPESHLYVRTRNGGSSQLFRYWKYTGMGDHTVEVTPEEYEELPGRLQAEPTYNYDSWNPWTSRFHLVNGGAPPPVFPVPRRSFQFSLEFVSSGEEGTRLEFLEFRASEAAVARVVGELDPVRVKAGSPTRFTYALRPRIHEGDPGFDLLEIRAVAARIDAVQAVLIDGAEVPFQILELEDRRALLRIPRVAGLAYSDAIVEVLFDARVLRFGGAFMGQIADSGRPHDVPQPVLSGDAIDEALGDRVWIETSIAVESALEARAEPAAFTPNGDGVNDRVEIAWDLVEVTRPVSVEVEIRDLSGRRVRLLHSGEEGIGRYRRWWDGRLDDGTPGAPGIYLYRVTTTDVSGERFAEVGPLRVVY